MLSRQISAYNYYKTIHGAWLDKKRTGELLSAFKLCNEVDLTSFKSFFQWTLTEFDNEFEGMTDNQYFVRFAVIRKLFLDYNL